MEYIQQIKTEIFNLSNTARIQFGLEPTAYSSSLEQMAQIHTNEMYTHQFFSHLTNNTNRKA